MDPRDKPEDDVESAETFVGNLCERRSRARQNVTFSSGGRVFSNSSSFSSLRAM
jgi:hypothetical protein